MNGNRGDKTLITAIEEAHAFVQEVKICTIFESAKSKLPSLWEHVDLPEKQPGEKGWGQKISAVWSWKNLLPATYPDEIFYGKIKGGFAVLMEMGYLRETHFPDAYRNVEGLKPLSRKVFEKIRLEPWDTTRLRRAVLEECGTTKSRFDGALKELQISMNIVRSNDEDADRDVWLTFKEVYPEVWNAHVPDS